ncbi:glycine cleavage system aminomethyltransferase GcvT [Rhodospirillaceae bacterium KN72]|uniref:aminomethyltransferase n=1 Tax=Pacificispira spongiicola TaxID=2729598 RepID=A0A7Y0HG67_9PROT|nr:glycine cleavage system aminomethyltransferase GcvT [Pacificispira spongiicola]NMM44602.1 glycine cleavage system aminomethyltransferase GcvT [Pacificispira spongiicola]
MSSETLKTTPLHALHVELGAKMVPFAGYDMPVQYPLGILKEHLHTREGAGLFDVSHMGQAWLVSETGDDPAIAFESLVPADVQGLAPGQQRYSQLLNDDGGILDDLMVTRPLSEFGSDRLYLVVNAACKDQDLSHIAEALKGRLRVEPLEDRALLALQGPKAANVAARLFGEELSFLPFMGQARIDWLGADLWFSRSGYTGEDGYEISVPADKAESLARVLLAEPEVEAIGLGARDSLRLEAGLCLYGHDIDTTTTPVEAGLVWSIGKRRRTDGGFPGFDTVAKQLADGAARKRVGILPEGRAPAREGTPILDADGAEIGMVTSGGFGPTLGGPVAMGYVPKGFAKDGTPVFLSVRGKALPANIVKLPFVPPGFYRV